MLIQYYGFSEFQNSMNKTVHDVILSWRWYHPTSSRSTLFRLAILTYSLVVPVRMLNRYNVLTQCCRTHALIVSAVSCFLVILAPLQSWHSVPSQAGLHVFSFLSIVVINTSLQTYMCWIADIYCTPSIYLLMQAKACIPIVIFHL